MTLASILRAQLATGRPLRVTRALLEALVEPPPRTDGVRWALARELEQALGVGDTHGDDQLQRAVERVRALCAVERERDEARRNAQAWERERDEWSSIAERHLRERDAARRELDDLDLVLPVACGSRVDAARELERERDEAYKYIAELDALVPCDDYTAPPMRTMTSSESQKVAGWAIATCARVMRGELDAHPEGTRNRLTIGVVWDDERWSLTLARGDYEHAMEAQRDEARRERDEERARANEWLAQKHDAERERGALLAEIDRLRGLIDAAGAVISEIGCECACACDEDHDGDCEGPCPCSVCRIADALQPQYRRGAR